MTRSEEMKRDRAVASANKVRIADKLLLFHESKDCEDVHNYESKSKAGSREEQR